jgi:phosphatidylglycerol lysyltransferase
MSSGKAPPHRIGHALGGVVLEITPQIAAIAAFVAGVTILASAATPAVAERLRVLTNNAPLFLVEVSHFAASLVGLLLMLVGSGLWRRREGAFWVALALLLSGAVLSLTKGLEYEETVLLLLIAAILWSARRAFDRPSRLLTGGISTGWLTATVAVVVSAGVLGFAAYSKVDYTDALWWRSTDTSRFLRGGVAVAVLTLAAAVMTLFSSPTHKRATNAAQDLADAEAVLAAMPDAPASSRILLSGDKDFFFSESRKSFIAYRVRASRWIALGGPMGEASEYDDLMWRFVEAADRAGGTAVFYSAGPDLLPPLAGMGFILRQIGEAAIVDPAAFNLVGKAKQNLRTACNKAAAEGCTFEVAPAGSASLHAEALKAVSDAWLKTHASAEKGFSMGRFDLAYLDRGPLGLVRKDGRIIAFANVIAGGREAGVDLMRYDATAPAGIMDFLFVRLIEWARDQGYAQFNLGMAPLSGLQNRRLAPVFARLGALVFAEASLLYSFGGLHAYKAKFFPRWRPMYMAVRPGVIMPFALLDVALLTGGGWKGLLFKG